MAAKVVNISVPFVFKYLIDFLNENTGNRLNFETVPEAVASTAFALVVACELLARIIGYSRLKTWIRSQKKMIEYHVGSISSAPYFLPVCKEHARMFENSLYPCLSQMAWRELEPQV